MSEPIVIRVDAAAMRRWLSWQPCGHHDRTEASTDSIRVAVCAECGATWTVLDEMHHATETRVAEMPRGRERTAALAQLRDMRAREAAFDADRGTGDVMALR